MMKLLFIFNMLLILASCGKIKKEVNNKIQNGLTSEVNQTSDARFDEFKDLFNKNSYDYTGITHNLDSIPINYGTFQPSEGHKIAKCVVVTQVYKEFGYTSIHTREQVEKEILVNKDRFDKLSEILQEYTIEHELGHCIFNMEHDDSMNNGHFLSIMNSKIMNEIDFEENYDYYQEAFFTGNSSFLNELYES